MLCCWLYQLFTKFIFSFFFSSVSLDCSVWCAALSDRWVQLRRSGHWRLGSPYSADHPQQVLLHGYHWTRRLPVRPQWPLLCTSSRRGECSCGFSSRTKSQDRNIIFCKCCKYRNWMWLLIIIVLITECVQFVVDKVGRLLFWSFWKLFCV